MEPSFEYERDADFFDPCGGEDEERDDDMERDRLLEQQELEDFEQADEYFDHWNTHEDQDW